MPRKILFRRAVAAIAKEEPKPKTYTTVECMVREFRRLNSADAARTLAIYISRAQNDAAEKERAENRRLRGEVRRLRRALRGAIPFIGYQAHVPEIVQEAEAALAPRRRKS